MKRWIRIILYSAAAAVILYLAALGVVLFVMYRLSNPSVHTYWINPNVQLNEQLAIGYSRMALADEGEAVPHMGPIQYWYGGGHSLGSDQFFARNTIDANRGYIQWSNGYTVTLERIGNEVRCRAYRPM